MKVLLYHVIAVLALAEWQVQPASTSELIAAPARALGHSVASIENAVRRDPRTAVLKQAANTQSPIPNGQLVLDYGGLIITLRISTYAPSSGLEAVDVADTAWLTRLGLSVPALRSDVLRTFGTAAQTTANDLVYEEHGESASMSVRLTFSKDRLVRVRWVYSFE
jgi:hypothetical protein